MGVEYLSSINLGIGDATQFAAQIAVFCPRLREIRVDSSPSAIECLRIDSREPDSSISDSDWTTELVQQSRWYGNIRPLSGLRKASIVVTGFNSYDHRSAEDQAKIFSNIALVQSEFEQSATRPAEAPPLLPAHNLIIHGFPEASNTLNHLHFAIGVRLLLSA